MFARNLSLSDLDYARTCILDHPTCYGIKIDHRVLIERISELIKNNTVVGVFQDDMCLGISSQTFWATIPIWHMSNLYLKRNSQGLYMGDKEFNVIGLLLEASIKNAESKGYFEFYYVIRDSLSFSRKNQGYDAISKSNPNVAIRYRFENIHILKSEDDIKWQYLENLVGALGRQALKNKKTLIIRRAVIHQEFKFSELLTDTTITKGNLI